MRKPQTNVTHAPHFRFPPSVLDTKPKQTKILLSTLEKLTEAAIRIIAKLSTLARRLTKRLPCWNREFLLLLWNLAEEEIDTCIDVLITPLVHNHS